MKKLFALVALTLICKFLISQKLVSTYYDWNKIHPKEKYYVNSAGQMSGSYKLYNQNGVVIKEYTYLNGSENGLCIDYAATENNQRIVASKGSFKLGQPDGAFVQYCDQDNYKSKVTEGSYKEGKEIGLWKEWWCTKILGYPDVIYTGVLKSVGSYKAGKYDGFWSFYNEKGMIVKSGFYKEGIEDGTWKFYNPTDTSKILYSGKYLIGKRVGTWRVYQDKKGNETNDPKQFYSYSETTFDDSGNPTDTLIKRYYMSGSKHSEFHVTPVREWGGARLERNGSYVEYYESGKVWVENNYKMGKEHGDWKAYYESGGIYRQGRNDNGSTIWEYYKEFYESGQPKPQPRRDD